MKALKIIRVIYLKVGITIKRRKIGIISRT